MVLAALAACGAGAAASRDGGTAPDTDAATPAPAAVDAAQPASEPPCVARATRIFVGFSEGMSLDDFELAATESERVMQRVQSELCERAGELEPTGALGADLAAGTLELFEVQFVRDDASAADVGLRRADAPDAGTNGSYRLALERIAGVWRLVTVTLPS